MNASIIQTIAVFALPVLFAITLHEAAHGYAAKYFGDNTAYALGRVSLNPMRHIDPVGTILMPLLMYFATNGAFLFGYAKPVPVYFGRLRNPRWHGMWVALAGPAANFVMAIGWVFGAILLRLANIDEEFLIKMVEAGILTNLVMCAFNLFPLPPLDGGRVLTALLPPRLALSFAKVEPYGFYIVMALVVAKVVDTLWMRPVMALLSNSIDILLYPIYALLR